MKSFSNSKSACMMFCVLTMVFTCSSDNELLIYSSDKELPPEIYFADEKIIILQPAYTSERRRGLEIWAYSRKNFRKIRSFPFAMVPMSASNSPHRDGRDVFIFDAQSLKDLKKEDIYYFELNKLHLRKILIEGKHSGDYFYEKRIGLPAGMWLKDSSLVIGYNVGDYGTSPVENFNIATTKRVQSVGSWHKESLMEFWKLAECIQHLDYDDCVKKYNSFLELREKEWFSSLKTIPLQTHVFFDSEGIWSIDFNGERIRRINWDGDVVFALSTKKVLGLLNGPVSKNHPSITKIVWAQDIDGSLIGVVSSKIFRIDAKGNLHFRNLETLQSALVRSIAPIGHSFYLISYYKTSVRGLHAYIMQISVEWK